MQLPAAARPSLSRLRATRLYHEFMMWLLLLLWVFIGHFFVCSMWRDGNLCFMLARMHGRALICLFVLS
jgi:hypothetical protein